MLSSRLPVDSVPFRWIPFPPVDSTPFRWVPFPPVVSAPFRCVPFPSSSLSATAGSALSLERREPCVLRAFRSFRSFRSTGSLDFHIGTSYFFAPERPLSGRRPIVPSLSGVLGLDLSLATPSSVPLLTLPLVPLGTSSFAPSREGFSGDPGLLCPALLSRPFRPANASASKLNLSPTTTPILSGDGTTL